MGGDKHWTHPYRFKDRHRVVHAKLRMDPYPLVVDFEIDCWMEGFDPQPLFSLLWRPDDGSIHIKNYSKGATEPTTRRAWSDVSSAHAGYALVEDELDDEAFWQQQKERAEDGHAGEGAKSQQGSQPR